MSKGKINILIAGLGAVGGYFGTFLAQNKNLDVCFLSRGKTYEHLKTNPLVLKSFKGYEISFKPNVSDDVLSFGKKFDYVFICTKSQDTSSLIKKIKKVVHEGSVNVTLQNGIYNLKILKKAFGAKRVMQIICKIGVEMRNDYVVEHFSLGFMQIGEMNGKNSMRVEKLYSLLKNSGIDARVINNMKEEFWIKYAWNTIFNSHTYISMETVDYFLRQNRIKKFIMPPYDEIALIAKSQGVEFGEKAYKKIITDSMALSKFKTSAYQDRKKGKEPETLYFLSALLEIARKKNIKVIYLERMHTITSMIFNGDFLDDDEEQTIRS